MVYYPRFQGKVQSTALSLKLSSVQHVSNLFNDLLSVSSIIRDLNCEIIFIPLIVFPNRKYGENDWICKMRDNLYMLDTGCDGSVPDQHAL